jgi:hypothetical protein
VNVLIASWFIWVPLLVGGIVFYVAQQGRAAAAEAEADAARRAEEARLAAEGRAAERRMLEARFPAVHARQVPARSLSDPNLQFVEVVMESGGRCYVGRAAEGTSIEVVTRKRKAGDVGGRYSGPYAAWVFDAAADRWTMSSSPPGAREIRSAIADLRRLDRLVAEDEAMPETFWQGGPPAV